ncbi:MAG: DHH family phosphoesterase, partial [Lachnospiraceae bacterium]|nr:DHH family phosphoesterase [Lachnospiraceae bacterium]
MAKWMVAAKKADFDRISEKYHISPVIARIIRNRDVVGDEAIERFLKGDLKDMYAPGLMKDMTLAADIILGKIRQGKSIRIIGDYDVDGICATYILLTGIRALGGKADTAIPHRMKDGYGLNESLIETAAEDGIDTIVTCDNGIAAAPQIKLAKAKGMTVVVTDHHEVPFEDREQGRVYLLPEADAVVDPKQPDCAYPYKQICGAVVAAKLVRALMDREDAPVPELQIRERLEEEMFIFGALATVCDVMELKDENRIIVKKGLALMKNTSNLGLKALLTVNGIEDRELSPYHAGFV